jgi:predicted lipoprotein with Yx(FWY)xxD motif
MLRIAAATTVLVLAATACSSSGNGGGTSPAAHTTTVRISVSHGMLVGPNGHTIYSNTADSASHLICTGQCLSLWPPVYGTPSAGNGVSASALGTIMRGSQVQATFDGHPLYEFYQDAKPGDTNGNGVTDAGGTWHPATVSGQPAAPAPSTGGAKSGGGGGYGNYP